MNTKQPEALRVAAWLINTPGSTTLADMSLAGHELRRLHAENAAMKRQQGEQLVRYCPDCGRVGEVPATARDCCPDGGHARYIPEKLAEASRVTFLRSIGKAEKQDAGAPNSAGWKEHARIMEKDRDYWKGRAEAMDAHKSSDVWYWQGEGHDKLESMVGSLVVVIYADQLRDVLTKVAAEPVAMSAVQRETVAKLLELARIVDRAVEDWGESLADGSSNVIFHKDEADARDAILDYLDGLPDNPDPMILESGPARAARLLAAPQAQPADADGIRYRWLFGSRTPEQAASAEACIKNALPQDYVLSELQVFYVTKVHADGLIDTAMAAAQETPPAPADLWYLQDTRGYVGNDVSWWAKDGNGYTTDVSKAHIYTRADAFKQAAMRGCDRAWPKAYIDGKTRPAVDMQYIDHAEAMASVAKEGGQQ